MANAYHHAVSSARRFGGTPEAYQPIHDWLDASKMIIADFRHRALRHHAEGCFAAVMWTCKRGLILALMEVVVPVVHRRPRRPHSAYQRASGAGGGEVPVDPPGRAPGHTRCRHLNLLLVQDL